MLSQEHQDRLKGLLEDYAVLLSQKKEWEKKQQQVQDNLHTVGRAMFLIEKEMRVLPQGVSLHKDIAVVRTGAEVKISKVHTL